MFIAGYTNSSLSLGDGAFNGTVDHAVFHAKFDSNGTFQSRESRSTSAGGLSNLYLVKLSP